MVLPGVSFLTFLTKRCPSMGLYPGVEEKDEKREIYRFDREMRALQVLHFLV